MIQKLKCLLTLGAWRLLILTLVDADSDADVLVDADSDALGDTDSEADVLC